jgi:diguanylate cyclase (GGDEF)-like protein/PAS domain S-box-containing protein
MVTDMDGVIQSVNPAFTHITGYPAQEAIGKTPRLLRSDRHSQDFHTAVWQQVASRGFWQGEIWNRRKSGEVFLEWQTITRIGAADRAAARYVAVFHDITDSWQKNENTRQLAFHDALTKLPNRALLMERLERQIAFTEREPRLIAVIFLDIDGFKAVNDTLGHAVGDELLIAIAQKLQALVRQSDTVARLGGDEFVIQLDSPANREEVGQVADRFLAAINEVLDIQGHRVQVAASIGITVCPDDGNTAAGLIKGADMAMYEAKRAGKNRVRFFDAGSAGVAQRTDVRQHSP